MIAKGNVVRRLVGFSVAGIAAVVGAAAFLMHLQGSEQNPRTYSAGGLHREKIAAARKYGDSELQTLKSSVALLEARLNAQLANDRALTDEAPPDTSDREAKDLSLTSEEALAASRSAFARRQSIIHGAMQRESRDSVWASETEGSVERVLESLDDDRFPTTWLDRVECQRTICRVTVKHESKGEALNLIEEIAGTIAGVNQTYGRFDEDAPGSFLTTLYLGRAGNTLPKAPASD